MSSEPSFRELIERIRAGDQEAAAEVVRRYEPTIRRAVRFRLADTRLGTYFDSMDICQSVLASFFLRASSGEYELETPEQLLKLLTRMARNKLASQVRREHADRRDNRRVTSIDSDVAAAGPTPGERIAAKELLQEVRRRLSEEERELVELRNQGLDWETIAAQLGSSSLVLRKKLSRALNRVARELGLDE